MQNSWQPPSVSIRDIYYISNPPIPAGHKVIDFRPVKIGDLFLDKFTGRASVASITITYPRLILEKVKELTELEKIYGEGETVESVWAKQCPNPQDYGKPEFGRAPLSHGWATPRGVFEKGILSSRSHSFENYIHAPLLNKWQRIYGESVKDTNDPRMQALLEPDEEFEEEPRVPEAGEDFAGARRSEENPFYRMSTRARWDTHGPTNGLRAIIRKKPAPKERFLKVPLGSVEIVSIQEPAGSHWRIYSWGNVTVGGADLGVTIIEE